MRAGDWKLLEFFEDSRLELDNLADALGEQQDRAERHLQQRDALQARMRPWRRELNAPLPQPASLP